MVFIFFLIYLVGTLVTTSLLGGGLRGLAAQIRELEAGADV